MDGKKKIIIFGATGNVGSYVTKYASEFYDKDKYEVIASGRRNTDVFEPFGVQFIQVDMLKKEDFEKLPTENVHAVVLLAATIPSYMSDYDGEKYLSTNIALPPLYIGTSSPFSSSWSLPSSLLSVVRAYPAAILTVLSSPILSSSFAFSPSSSIRFITVISLFFA